MIALACDHIGYELKLEIIKLLEEMNLTYQDFGTHNTDRCDYPFYAHQAARAVAEGKCAGGILICGSGVGMSIAANKVNRIRCVVCSEPYSAILSKKHNNTNMLAVGSRVVGSELAKMIVRGWLEAEYEGGRHQLRIDMIHNIESDLSR